MNISFAFIKILGSCSLDISHKKTLKKTIKLLITIKKVKNATVTLQLSFITQPQYNTSSS